MKKEQDLFTIRLSVELKTKLQELADNKEITLSALIRSLLIEKIA